MSLTAGLSSYKDECLDAAHALDRRRQEHERRFRRTRVQKRPATRTEMIGFIQAVGPTDLVDDPTLMHAPVVPVAGGIAFDPRRMTVSTLQEVYERCKGLRRPAEGPVVDRVQTILETYSTGLRVQDIVALSGAGRTSVRRALDMMVLNQEVHVRTEPSRPHTGASGKLGTPRKRYWPQSADPASVDDMIAGGVF